MQLTLHFVNKNREAFGVHDYESILESALDRFGHRLKQVRVYVQDVNGPRGGIDKQCRCVLHLRRMSPIVIQDRDENIATLIHRVAQRASYAMRQKNHRDNQRRRPKSARKPSAAFANTESGQSMVASDDELGLPVNASRL